MTDIATEGHAVLNVHPVLLSLPAHLLKAGDVVYFPAAPGNTATSNDPLAIVVGVDLPEKGAPYLDDDELVAVVTEDSRGAHFVDYVPALRMFPVSRQEVWHVSPSA